MEIDNKYCQKSVSLFFRIGYREKKASLKKHSHKIKILFKGC